MIDAHLHVVYGPDVDLVSHLSPGGPWWERVDPSIESVLGRAQGAGVGRAVFVQAIGAHGYDCSYLLSAAGLSDVALVGAVDPFGPDPLGALDDLIAAGVAGLRLFSIRAPEPWLDGEVGRSLVARCIEGDITPSVCVLPDEIPALLRLAAAFPGTEFALDHVGFAAGDDDVLAALARQDNLCPTVTATSGLAIDQAVSRFGRDRLSWGSDHPQHGAEYPEPIELPAAGRLWFGTD